GPFFGLTRSGSEKGRGRLIGVVAGLLGGGFVLGLAATLIDRFHALLLLPIALGYLVFVYDLRGIYGRRPDIRRTATLTGVRIGNAYLAALAVALLLLAFGTPLQ